MAAFAQLEVKEGSFKEVKGFVNIKTEKMYDDNDKPYAVLKIRTENISSKERRELNFKGDAQTFFEVEYNDGEVWLYISYYATYIKIYHEEFSSTEFWFPFDMKPKCGYELTLVNTSLIDLDIQKDNDRFKVYEYVGDTIINANTFKEEAFSVNPDKKVCFSRGNLQYQAYTKTWRFAENQWDYIGDANGDESSYFYGWIDLFGWGTSGYDGPTYTLSTDKNDYGSHGYHSNKYDWGVYNTISNDESKKWRTLTKEEWSFLLNIRRTTSGIRYAKANVNGVNGIILLPDKWNSKTYELNNTNMSDASFTSNIINQINWANMLEPQGVVFLPAAGCRMGRTTDYVGACGYYWSAPYNRYHVEYQHFSDESLFFVDWDDRLIVGRSVRLVCDIK